MSGEDYEAAKPVPARTLVTGDPWVRDHLPECAERRAEWRWSEDCICDRLRACEQRVREAIRQPGRVTLAVEDAYAAGVQAARDAVAALPFVRPAYYGKGVLIHGAEPDFVRGDALAAIDGLKGEQA